MLRCAATTTQLGSQDQSSLSPAGTATKARALASRRLRPAVQAQVARQNKLTREGDGEDLVQMAQVAAHYARVR